MNHCPLPHRSVTIFTGYCAALSSGEIPEGFGFMSVIEVRMHTIYQGKRDEFVELFDKVPLPAQREFDVIAVQPTPGSAIR
jgi:hypothetical protein